MSHFLSCPPTSNTSSDILTQSWWPCFPAQGVDWSNGRRLIWFSPPHRPCDHTWDRVCSHSPATGDGPSPAPGSSQHHALSSTRGWGFSHFSSAALFFHYYLTFISIQTFLIFPIIKNFPWACFLLQLPLHFFASLRNKILKTCLYLLSPFSHLTPLIFLFIVKCKACKKCLKH